LTPLRNSKKPLAWKRTSEFSSATSGRRLINLEILRFYAACSVVLLHLAASLDDKGQHNFYIDLFGSWGASGVDIFFVISGFVIARSYFIKAPTVWNFVKARVRRIVPIYWILTLLVGSLWAVFPSLFRSYTVSFNDVFTSLFFVARLTGVGDPVLWIGWTLEFEMLFYVLFAFGLLTRFRNAAPVFAALALASCVFWLGAYDIVLEFILGMLIAFIAKKIKISPRIGSLILIAGCLALVLAIGIRHVGDFRVLVYGLPSALIVLGATSVRQLPAWKWPSLGFASYSIYLTQALTIPVVIRSVTGLGFEAISADIWLVIALSICVLFGIIFSELVDKPLFQNLRRIGF
jgi:exopolysaccharide production protein ExoZ